MPTWLWLLPLYIAGTPVGDCIAGVVRRAHFPAFRAATQNLMFPYVITPPTGH